MGSACGSAKPESVSNPVQVNGQKKSEKHPLKKGASNDDMISIGSLKSRLSLKRNEHIGYFLVEGVKKLEKDQKKVTKEWKLALAEHEKEREKEIRSEKIFSKKTDNVLLSFKIHKFNRFQQLIESGIPLNLRWNVWKAQMFNQNIYDESLYGNLLQQPIDEHYETAIFKDLPRTFPVHPFFNSKEATTGGVMKLSQLNPGQKKLYNVLKALAIHMPNVGYTQGMNFVLAFLLMMSAGNESDAFWVFLLMAKDPEYLFMGLFEEQLPLMHIYLYIFEQKFKSSMPQLYDHFQSILLDSMIWVWKWFITLYLYSFPIEIVAKLWDYIIINGGLSTISLGLALAQYYEKEFLKLDMEDMQSLLAEFKDSNMLLDIHSKFYLDFARLRKIAKKYTITHEFASFCVVNMAKEKKMDNMYTKYYIMLGQNEKEAVEWIYRSVEERVKLSASETIMHLGSVLKQSNQTEIYKTQNSRQE